MLENYVFLYTLLHLELLLFMYNEFSSCKTSGSFFLLTSVHWFFLYFWHIAVDCMWVMYILSKKKQLKSPKSNWSHYSSHALARRRWSFTTIYCYMVNTYFSNLLGVHSTVYSWILKHCKDYAIYIILCLKKYNILTL